MTIHGIGFTASATYGSWCRWERFAVVPARVLHAQVVTCVAPSSPEPRRVQVTLQLNNVPACALLHSMKAQSLLPSEFPLLLTDLFPGFPNAFPPNVSIFPQPYPACDAFPELPGFKSLFNAYHHFDESAKIALINKHGSQGLFVVEILQPTPFVFLKILLTTTVGQLLLAPFVRPFSWKRLALTYLFPINLLTITFDGLMSVIRVDSLAQMHHRAEQHLPKGCSLYSGTSGPWWAPLSWFYIVPSRNA